MIHPRSTGAVSTYFTIVQSKFLAQAHTDTPPPCAYTPILLAIYPKKSPHLPTHRWLCPPSLPIAAHIGPGVGVGAAVAVAGLGQPQRVA